MSETCCDDSFSSNIANRCSILLTIATLLHLDYIYTLYSILYFSKYEVYLNLILLYAIKYSI